jgi:hypothetical protein
MLGWIAKTNWGITQELLYWDRLYALITFELMVLVYPIWLIGVIAIIKEWRSRHEEANSYASNDG